MSNKMQDDFDFLLRYETFGGIIATNNPPALTFVDKNYIKELNRKDHEIWSQPDSGILSGPIEAHYAITDYCSLGCSGCYMASSNDFEKLNDKEADLQKAISVAKTLAEMKIFHVALGGGESFSIPWFFELADCFRRNDIVPNVTTNGHLITPELAEKCKVFGQVNVSLDSTDNKLETSRPEDHFQLADHAIELLQKNNIRVGINCVISRKNYDSLEEIIAYAKKKKIVDIEFLRFKPSGRGKDIYHEMKLKPEQVIELYPKLIKLARKYRVGLKLDCSFTPFICFHNPPKKVLEYFAILGCDAGNWLIGVNANGLASPCSFIENEDIPLEQLAENWSNTDTFSSFRNWGDCNDTICSKCKYLSICKGGCHAVSRFVSGSLSDPDPECPFVVRGYL